MTPDSTSRNEFFRSKRAQALLSEFDPARTPAHVAIIMDGNGRWAAKRGLPRLAGHSAGAKAVRETIAAAIELGISYLTIYSFSSENWNRPADEVSGLMSLFVDVLERELANLERMNVRVLVIGDMDGTASRDARRVRTRGCIAPPSNDGLTLVVALNYGGRSEIVHAARSIARDVAAGTLDPDSIDESLCRSQALHGRHTRSRPARPHKRGTASEQLPALADRLQRDVGHADAVARLRPCRPAARRGRVPEARPPFRGSIAWPRCVSRRLTASSRRASGVQAGDGCGLRRGRPGCDLVRRARAPGPLQAR